MLDYIFFHQQLLDQFVEHLRRNDVPYTSVVDDMGLVVGIPDDTPEAVVDKIDAVYEALVAQSEHLLAEEGHPPESHTASISFRLSDGSTASASVAPQLLNRILSAITYAELNELVSSIVAGIECPDDRPLCRR